MESDHKTKSDTCYIMEWLTPAGQCRLVKSKNWDIFRAHMSKDIHYVAWPEFARSYTFRICYE